MDGNRICRLVDRRYPSVDQLLASELRNLPSWELIPYSFVDLNGFTHFYLASPPLPPCERFHHDAPQPKYA